MTLQEKIKQLKLQIQILLIQIQIILLRQKRTVPNLSKPIKIILHHGGGWLDFEEVNVYHKMKWGFKSSLGYYAGYTYFIERDGKVTQARSDIEQGAHTKGHNRMTIGIGLMGNGVEEDFTPEQYESLKRLVDKKRLQYNISKTEIYGHNQFANTICPSDPIKKWLEEYKRSY